MKIYLDDDSTNPILIKLLKREGHDVLIPRDVKMSGQKDPAHLMYAIRHDRVLLTHNHEDFELLHELIMLVRGHHPGIMAVRRDNDPKRDLTPKGIAQAIRKLVQAAAPVADELNVLNHWR
jgi:predicted nuclease of predicted toxin-antitoxin system